MTICDTNACLNKKAHSEISCILKRQFCPTAKGEGLCAWSHLLLHRQVSLHLLVQMEAEVSCGSCTVNHRSKTMLSFPAWCSYGCICLGAEIEMRVGPSPLLSRQQNNVDCRGSSGSHLLKPLAQSRSASKWVSIPTWIKVPLQDARQQFTGFGWCFEQICIPALWCGREAILQLIRLMWAAEF